MRGVPINFGTPVVKAKRRPFKNSSGHSCPLRFTNSVDRETGGFSKYLMNGVFARVGNQFRQMNHRDELEKSIRDALGTQFEVDAIGFFAWKD